MDLNLFADFLLGLCWLLMTCFGLYIYGGVVDPLDSSFLFLKIDLPVTRRLGYLRVVFFLSGIPFLGMCPKNYGKP